MGVAQSLPEEISQGLTQLCQSLQKAAGANLQGLILYGGAARGRYHPESSDINLLILLGDASADSLKAIAPALEVAGRSFRADPFILITSEFNRAAELFPTKFIEIGNHHVVLHGTDPFVDLKIPTRFALVRVEQELKNFEMRLRRRYLTIHASPQLLLLALKQIVVPLAVALDALHGLKGRTTEPANTRAGALQEAGRVFGLDETAILGLAALRAGEAPALQAEDLFERVMKLIAVAADRAAAMMREGAS